MTDAAGALLLAYQVSDYYYAVNPEIAYENSVPLYSTYHAFSEDPDCVSDSTFAYWKTAIPIPTADSSAIRTDAESVEWYINAAAAYGYGGPC